MKAIEAASFYFCCASFTLIWEINELNDKWLVKLIFTNVANKVEMQIEVVFRGNIYGNVCMRLGTS